VTVGSVGTIGSGVDGSGTADGSIGASAAGTGAGAVVRSGVWVGFTDDGIGRCADGPDRGCAMAALLPVAGTLCFGLAAWLGDDELVGLCAGATVALASCGTTTVRLARG